MIADVLNLYGQEVAPDRVTARNIGYKIGCLLRWWGDKTVADITPSNCKAYVSSRGKPHGASSDLKTLAAAVKYWNANYKALDVVPSFWRPAEPEPRERWLTRDEAARLVKASKPYQHIRRLILLGLYTGSRPGVLLALKWDQVDFAAEIMTRKRGRQADNKRAPRVRLGRRILGHLRRWKKIDGKGAVYVCAFQSPFQPGAPRAVQDPHGAWAKVVAAAGLEGVTRHTLRHTRATWMAQKGVSLFEAAGFLGMSVKTLERTYAHHDPSHQERAANI